MDEEPKTLLGQGQGDLHIDLDLMERGGYSAADVQYVSDLRHDQIDREHQAIEEQITFLEETLRQHFANEALLIDLRTIVGPDSQEKIDEIIAAHNKSHQGLLAAIESIANEFRDHMLLEELGEVVV